MRICQSCGGSFPTIPARLKGLHKALYCSQECRKEGTRRRDERVCPTCGKTFVIPMTSSKNQEHCSAACRYLDVTLHPEKHPLWRGGGGNYYGTLWRLRADEVRERDEETCQDCGKKQHRPKLHVHHLQPRRTFRGDHEKADHLNNLITLCLSCHMKREGRIKSPGKKR